jgi:thiol-disulfide isomerase/thioredoxin
VREIAKFAAVLAIVGGAAFGFITQLRDKDDDLRPGTAVPGFRLLSLAGGTTDLGSLRGRVVLVNFWATWCVPCREEFPDLVRLQSDLAPRGLRVLGISTDFTGQTAAVERFLASTKPNFDNYRKKSGDDQAFIETVDRVWGGELPFSVLYGRDGRKVKVFSGRHPYEQYRAEIVKLLGTGDRP